jgi:hypothetical protein
MHLVVVFLAPSDTHAKTSEAQHCRVPPCSSPQATPSKLCSGGCSPPPHTHTHDTHCCSDLITRCPVLLLWRPPCALRSPPDESLTILLTSLLRSLADATTTATNSSSSSSFPAATQAPQIPGHQCTPLTASDASDRLVQLLTQWADEFLLSDPTPVTSTQKVPGSTPAEPATVAKQLFMQLLAELLPPVGTSGPTAATTGTARRAPKGPQQQQQQPNLGRGLLAATAAAFTAREVVSRLQQRSEAEGSSAGSSRSHAPGVKHSAGSTTGRSVDTVDWLASECGRMYGLGLSAGSVPVTVTR